MAGLSTYAAVMDSLLLGTRASPLAIAQSDRVIAALDVQGLTAQPRIFSTQGDRVLDQSFQALGDKGMFTAELEAALHQGLVQAAVHSAKDMSALDDPALPIVAVLPRDSRVDALIAQDVKAVADLPARARIGTSSLRRAAQLRQLRPDLIIVPVRGNLQTRIRKWRQGEVDALLLAAAGLDRLDLRAELPAIDLPLPYAPCQGIIAIQARERAEMWRGLSCAATMTQLAIERALVRGLGANCRQPVACQVDGDVGGGFAIQLYAWGRSGRCESLTHRLAAGQSDEALAQDAETQARALAARLPEGLGGA